MQTDREGIVEAIRQRLRTLRDHLIKRMSGVWPEMDSDDTSTDGPGSDVPEFAEFRLTERALQRIREGTYGRCEKCDGEIAGERLEVLPFAAICIRCQLNGAF